MSANITGFIGAHRTGKSTLVNRLTGLTKPSYKIEVSITVMQAKGGWESSNQSYDWETRKQIQTHLLLQFRELLHDVTHQRAWGGPLMTERTPLDLIGYLILNAPESPTEEDIKFINNYTAACVKLTDEFYNQIYFVQPGIPYKPESKSASYETIEKLSDIYSAILLSQRIKPTLHIIPEGMLDLNQRLAFIERTSNVRLY